MNAQPRILLSAYQCGDGLGSVSQIGWEWYSRLARILPVTLVTHVRNRGSIPALPQSDVIFVDTEAFAGPLYRAATRLFPRSQHAVFLLSSLDYFVFDRQSLRLLSSLQKEGREWDLIHSPTPVSPLAVPSLHRMGKPLLLGPWNGGLQSPKTFPEFMQQDSAWLYPVRNLGKVFQKINGGLEYCSLIFTATEATDAAIAPRYRSKCVRMLENGVDFSRIEPQPWPPQATADNPLKILFVGRLIPAKGVPMLLDAVAELAKQTPVELSVIGDGPELANLQQHAAALGLHSCVHFPGTQPLSEVFLAMSRAHVFCLPSVRESGGAVLLEAMAAARPVIAVAYGGPKEIVDETVGCAIAPRGRQYVVRELRAALLDVVRRPEVWRQRGQFGRQRAEQEYGWDAKVSRAITYYEKVLSGRSRTTREGEAEFESQTREFV